MSDRLRVALVCEQCGARNYQTTKTKDNKQPLQFKKFCRACNQHTVHKESK